MSSQNRPSLIYADDEGNIYDEPELHMLCRQGEEIAPPKPGEVIPLPPDSDLYLLPQRYAIGFNPETGQTETAPFSAIAAFVSPGYTLTGLSAYVSEKEAENLPLFSYAAVGYAKGQFWVTARKVDEDKRQVFTGIDHGRIKKGAQHLLKKFPENRLLAHLTHCALTYCCPAAKNLALGRFECPLPTARSCNARCIGCISHQDKNSGLASPQNRIDFRPSAEEISQVMSLHASREKYPVFSFGQGCEGEPLTESSLISSAVARYKKGGGKGTVNINTNASIPESVDKLAHAGLDSMRVTLNSVQEDLYTEYHRPVSYSFPQVIDSIARAKEKGLFVSLNYLFFPGINDTEEEFLALAQLVNKYQIDLIQMRNLNLDPEIYLETLPESIRREGRMGLDNFMRRIRKECPGVAFGYFNPYIAADHTLRSYTGQD